MDRLTGGGVSWLRRLFGRTADDPRTRPGNEMWVSTEQAIAALEVLACEGFVHTPTLPRSAASARRRSGAPPLNAFGRPVHEEVGIGAPGSVALATGMTLAGLRATAFLSGDELLAAHAELCATAEGLAPLVIHAVNGDSGHAGYHRVAGCGFFQTLASTGQEAIDLTLLARWLAERALVPGLVATDGGAIERLRAPDEELVQAFLGAPDESIVSPTEAQRLLFGSERPQLLRWFDPDRPVATGGARSRADEARARAGSHSFFWKHVADLAAQGMQELAQLTGRPLSFVDRHRLQDAELVLVCQGAAVQSARCAADAVRRRGWKVGVLGVSWLRPFPAREVAEALAKRRAVAVIESLDDPLASETPLRREVEAALGPAFGCTAATCAAPGPDSAQLAELCAVMREAQPPRHVRLDHMALAKGDAYPRREALVQSLASAYPELRAPGLAATEAGAVEPDAEGIRSVGLVGLEAELPDDAAGQLADALEAEAGPCVHGRVVRPAPGVIAMRLRAAAFEFADPGPRAAVALLLVATTRIGELGDPLAAVAPAGVVLLASADPPERVWASLPARCRTTVRTRALRVFHVGEGLEVGIDAIRAFLAQNEAALVADGKLAEIVWSELPGDEPVEAALPQTVRRIEQIRPGHDSLPRFWGEFAEPRQDGAARGFPDPLEASGAVPAGASGLQQIEEPGPLPSLDANLCTGCGRCWSACPDSALGVTVLGTEALLTATSRLAGSEGKAADALRRSHKHLATRLAGQLSQDTDGSLDGPTCQEAWSWLSGRLELSLQERPAYEEAFEATIDVLCQLQPVITETFFHEPEREKKGSGEPLVLAVDPRSCLGCNLCVKVCPEGALRLTDSTPESVSMAGRRWRSWEQLPDTSGPTLARAGKHKQVGELAALLLSRHCALAQLGDASGEPGSGQRLATRWVAALVEEHAQREVAKRVTELEQEHAKLEKCVREQLSEALSAPDMETLAAALGDVGGGRADLSALASRLDSLGAPADFDRRSALRTARLAAELERARWRLADGEEGLGRARFGVVAAEGTVSEQVARYPSHPYWAPLSVAATTRGVELARGIARGLVAEHVALVRLLRRAKLELEAPPDRNRRLEEIARLGWADLEAEERSGCPPLLLLGDDSALLDQGFEVLTRLLESDLPVKVVLLDGRGRLDAPSEPALVAMAHRNAFVLAGSLAHPDHFARGCLEGFRSPGPALFHVHAPSPTRHGFASDDTLEQARRAVEGRAHPLFRYDPRAEGLFGLRSSLEGNPGLDEDWGGASFPEWAAGESRFEDCFEPLEPGEGTPLDEWLALPERERRGRRTFVDFQGQRLAIDDRMAQAVVDRLNAWNVLREQSGTTSPFTDRIRVILEQELEAKLQKLKGEHAAALSAVRAGDDPELLARLTDRLMALAGYSSDDPPEENGG